jgi:hypothetical protein
MVTMTKLHETIAPIATAALEAGFTVFAPKETTLQRAAGFVYVCLDTNGSFAAIEVPTHPWDGAQLSAPIKPSRDYGSSVAVDFNGTTEGAIQSLRKVCESPTVTVRFVAKRGQAAPIVPNYGRKTIDTWPGGPERFEQVTTIS